MIFKDLREMQNLTQSQIERCLGLKQSAVGKWELGKALPKTKYIQKLAKLLNVTTDELLESLNII